MAAEKQELTEMLEVLNQKTEDGAGYTAFEHPDLPNVVIVKKSYFEKLISTQQCIQLLKTLLEEA